MDILRRLDFALHVLRDVHLFHIVLALAHRACQPLSKPFHFLLELIIFLQQHSQCKMVSKIHQLNQCKKLKHLPWRWELHKG
jgi:hypothetical protein